ncbi:hypothetical protein AV530_010555 [Patagioenas fasciata monilis]|uniref:Uncharacterized protein n=1 Tax=Patagioenas fasciata monilis TaxID=372326 RepID=A0A1V4KFN9_PATFA|nr:hypothetical protein AV530_010555 [Patagioenas fasciata monilis]
MRAGTPRRSSASELRPVKRSCGDAVAEWLTGDLYLCLWSVVPQAVMPTTTCLSSRSLLWTSMLLHNPVSMYYQKNAHFVEMPQG